MATILLYKLAPYKISRRYEIDTATTTITSITTILAITVIIVVTVKRLDEQPYPASQLSCVFAGERERERGSNVLFFAYLHLKLASQLTTNNQQVATCEALVSQILIACGVSLRCAVLIQANLQTQAFALSLTCQLGASLSRCTTL